MLLVACLASAVSALPIASDDDAAPPADAPPNVVLLFTDDQGWADVGCFGAEGFRTPRLDRMAAEGVRFTDFHVSQAVCSASRASLLTGCYAERVSVQGALGPGARTGLHPDEETIADVLRARGYATAAFGKWHLGHREPFLPTEQGFDEFAGLPYSNDMWPVDYDGVPYAEGTRKADYPALRWMHGDERGDEPADAIATLADQARLTARTTERALDFLERRLDADDGRPFFLYLAYSMPHVPLGRPLAFAEGADTPYGAVIQEIDDSVGRILDLLDARGAGEDTLVLFTSDNGPWLSYGDHAGSAGPLREGKGTMWEGGARVPCIARWPGRIPAGGTCERLAATLDVLPTLAELAGAAPPSRAIDGVSLVPLLDDPGGAPVRREYAYYYGGNLIAVRRDAWKLVFPHTYRTLEGGAPGADGHPGRYGKATSGLELYDLDADLGEETDVAAAHPDLVRVLEAQADRVRAALGDRLRDVTGAEVRPPGRLPPKRPSPVEHVALGKEVRLSTAPSGTYPGGGGPGLVDGVLGSEDFLDGRWLGFEGEDVEVVVDLGAPTMACAVTCSFLRDQDSWIFLPRAVELAVSADGTTFDVVERFEESGEPAALAEVRTFTARLEPREVRAVRLRATSRGACPDWHPGRGGDAWLFVDELVVE